MRSVVFALCAAAAMAEMEVSLRMEPIANSPCNDTVKQFAGYLDVKDPSDGGEAHYFAWFSESRQNPDTDPLIVWFSGGPGCSSSLAMFSENGPCIVNSDGKSTSRRGVGSWNNKANLMFVDQPANVGFSYSNAQGESTNETQVAAYMVSFFTQFYKAYPKYADNDLFIAAESYGGHYGPSIAYGLYEANKAGASFPLKGLSVGNGLVDPAHQYPTYPDFVKSGCEKDIGKMCVSESAYEGMVQAVPKCSQLIAACQDDVSACPDAQNYCNDAMFGPYEQTGLNPYDVRIPCEVPGLCYNFSAVDTFLNTASVQKAIGVNGIEWQSCNMVVNAMFSDDWMRNMAWKVPAMLADGIRVFIYAGVDDFIVQWYGNLAWVQALQWPGQKQFNATTPHDWHAGGAVAGQTRSYGGLSFTTVYGAGHMAPRDQPLSSETMINAFIYNKPLN